LEFTKVKFIETESRMMLTRVSMGWESRHIGEMLVKEYKISVTEEE
jgi:hypothetical protein